MKLPISVVITSSVPDRSLRSPGQRAQRAPPSVPAMMSAGMTRKAGPPLNASAAKAAQIAPT